MSKLTQSIRDELTEYFHGGHGIDGAIAGQSYEPRGAGYDPATDDRLARLVLKRRVNPDWVRVKLVIDDLATPVVEVLRLAVGGPHGVACRLPSALAQGRELALAEARQHELAEELAVARRLGCSPIACAMRVLEVDEAFRTGRRRVHVTPREVAQVTARAVHHGAIDVDDEATAVIDEAVDAYVVAREALKATRRGYQARLRAEAAAAVDEALGKKRRKERARFERILKGAA